MYDIDLIVILGCSEESLETEEEGPWKLKFCIKMIIGTLNAEPVTLGVNNWILFIAKTW